MPRRPWTSLGGRTVPLFSTQLVKVDAERAWRRSSRSPPRVLRRSSRAKRSVRRTDDSAHPPGPRRRGPGRRQRSRRHRAACL